MLMLVAHKLNLMNIFCLTKPYPTITHPLNLNHVMLLQPKRFSDEWVQGEEPLLDNESRGPSPKRRRFTNNNDPEDGMPAVMDEAEMDDVSQSAAVAGLIAIGADTEEELSEFAAASGHLAM